MKGKVDYQKYVLFDKGTHRFFDILKNIRAAAEDPRILAIALNLSGIRILPEHAWEIRQELSIAKLFGKKIVVFIDNAMMTSYHLASVADKIVIDPQGTIRLQGYVLGRTYLKGTLEKLGLGFDEWRFFKYKSAAEGLSRDTMSEADREQLQSYVDDWYELSQSDICSSRNITFERFDEIIDEEVFLPAPAALAAGLVDTLARWSSIQKVMRKMTGKKLSGIAAKDLIANAITYDDWGEKQKVAVVYAVGICAMDVGIRARWLERVLLKLANDSNVKAIVLRVDSPGGDGGASDLVAEALKKCKQYKPVIISQGQVAASGGYWLSMYGDTIIAAPNTITGSIGVIGGWVYDKGASEKLGLSSDHVQRGKHADLGFGVRLPFLGIRIPARNLRGEERGKIEIYIKDYYDRFVEKVANGRNMTPEEVGEIAQGRIYSGYSAKENGLIDRLGGLAHALDIAKKRAGIRTKDHIEILEIPNSKGLLKLNLSPIQSQSKDHRQRRWLDFVSPERCSVFILGYLNRFNCCFSISFSFRSCQRTYWRI